MRATVWYATCESSVYTMWDLDISQPYRPPWPVTGIALLLLLLLLLLTKQKKYNTLLLTTSIFKFLRYGNYLTR
jgi:hypothetical protein